MSEEVELKQEEAPEDVQITLMEEVANLKDQLLRSLAEQENVRKRTIREREDALKYAVSSFARELLSVSDNLRRALNAAPQEIDEQVKTFVMGVEMTEKELLHAFEKFGVIKISPENEKFDHNFHQAMFETEDADKEPGTVIQVLQPGYVLHDRLLRPALVGVSKKV
jgi:molecular chaperone GrpE